MSDRKNAEIDVMIKLGIVRQLLATREAKLFDKTSLSASQFSVLNHFTHQVNRRWTVTQLAAVMEMNQPGITKIVSVLLARNLLLSETDQDDKRKRYLYISAQGIKACRDTLEALVPDISHVFNDWEAGELAQFNQYMEKLMQWLDSHRDDLKSQGTVLRRDMAER